MGRPGQDVHPGQGRYRRSEVLGGGKRVSVVAKHRPAVGEDQHAHDVEADHGLLDVEVLGQVGGRRRLAGCAVQLVLGESLARVTVDVAADENQVVLVARDEVHAVLARPPAVLDDLEPAHLQELADTLHRLGLGCLVHLDLLSLFGSLPMSGPCGFADIGVPDGRKGEMRKPGGLEFLAVVRGRVAKKFFAALAP